METASCLWRVLSTPLFTCVFACVHLWVCVCTGSRQAGCRVSKSTRVPRVLYEPAEACAFGSLLAGEWRCQWARHRIREEEGTTPCAWACFF